MNHYIPKPDPEGINSPLESTPIQDALILVTGFLFLIGLLILVSGFVTEKIISRISIENETQFFQKIYKDQQGTHLVLKPFAQKIKPHISFPIQLKISCSDEVNAFSLPGGNILVTKGLLQKVKTENGLMFVLGHEIGHFIHRDHLQGFGRQIIISTILAFIGVGSDINQLLKLSQLPQSGFQRDQETKADAIGLDLMEKIYGYTQGADEFFNYLSEKESDAEKIIAKFTSTHPASSERLKFVRSRMNEKRPTNIVKMIQLTDDFYKNMNCE